MKKNIKIILCSIIAVASVSLVAANFYIARITPNKIEISSKEDFKKINDDLSGYYILTNSIVIDEEIIIGDMNHPFTGTIDGSFLHTISFANLLFSDNNNLFHRDGNYYFGVIPNNEGTIIHCNFSFDNIIFDIGGDSAKDCYCGGLTGLNNGKITSCDIKSSSSIHTTFFSKQSIKFGMYSGLNVGDIRKSKISRNIELQVDTSQTSYFGGFCGLQSINGTLDMCEKKSWLLLDKAKSNTKLYIGGFAGLLSGGTIVNCFGGRINVGFSNTSDEEPNLIGFGGFAGLYDGSDILTIKNSCYIGSSSVAFSNPTNKSGFSSSLISKCVLNSEKIIIQNSLVGGYCNSIADHNYTADVCLDEKRENKFNITNTFYIKDYLKYIYPDSSFVLDELSLKDISLSKMTWDGSIWEINNEDIIFKA